MDIATREVGTWFPSSFKLRNQISGSKEGEETHTECGPEGKDTRGTEVDEGPELDQMFDGEVGFGSRRREATPNSFEATSQGREICCRHRDLDSDPNVKRGERGDVRTDGGVGVATQPQPRGISNEQFLERREGRPLVGQEKPKEGVPGTSVRGKGTVGQRGLYTRDGNQSQLVLSCSNVWRW